MNFEIRSYRKSDQAMLLAISRRTWGGYDHLPLVFGKLLADPHCHIYVAAYKNKIVAFGILRILENGRTGWLEGLRVHPRYKRKGLGMLLTTRIGFLAEQPGVRRLRLLSEAEDPVLNKFPRRLGMAKLRVMNYLWKERISRPPLKPQPPALHIKVDPHTVFRMAQNAPELVPDNLLFYDWYALDLTRANLRTLGRTVGFWAGIRKGRTVSLSLGLRTADLHAQKWCCTIYASDRNAFISALYYQMKIMRQKRLNNLLCIHAAKFTETFKQIPELPKRTYLMQFGLFEKKL